MRGARDLPEPKPIRVGLTGRRRPQHEEVGFGLQFENRDGEVIATSNSPAVDTKDFAEEAAITPRTRAVMVADYCGMPSDYDGLEALVADHGLDNAVAVLQLDYVDHGLALAADTGPSL